MMKGPVWCSAAVAMLTSSIVASAQTWNSRWLEESASHPYDSSGVVGAEMPTSPVEWLLQKRVAGVDWEESTFDEVLDWLGDEAEGKVNIVPRWIALGIEDVDRDKLVTLKLNDTTVAEVLREVVDQLSETGEVAFRGEGNALRISTKQDFNKKLELRVYDVTDVLFRLPDFSESAPQIDLQRRNQGGGGGGGGSGGGQPIFRNAGGQSQEELSEEGEQDPEEILEKLRKMIEDVIEPDSWDTLGGRGRIRGFNKRSIIVLNTADVHEQIAGFFARHR